MRGVEVHRNTMRLQDPDQLVRDLHPDTLLDGEAPREQAHESGQLGDADDLLVRDVGDIRVPVEGQRVMLAQREELDRALDDLADLAVGTATALRWKSR